MADTASHYLPIDRRHALAQGKPLPEQAQGATLFADISGFTALTELLARELGPRRGAEELTVYLNQVYGALIAHVHRYGGSVTGFAGDGITCWFDGDDGRRAVASGLAMQRSMAEFSSLAVAGEGELRLAVKVAVAAGTVHRFVAGDPDILLLDVLGGTTLERLAAAEHQAQTGELIVDEDTASALADLLDVSTWRTGAQRDRYAVVAGLRAMPPEAPWPLLPAAALAGEQVRPWLLRPIFQRLQSGQGEYLAELRPAVILFLRFEGIDYEHDPAAARQLDSFIRQVQLVLDRHEGSLIQLTIGDKGSFLYVAFGAPVAHEDDVDRALTTALALQPLAAQFPFLRPFQTAITRGRTRVGAYGSSQRRTYGVLGDAVNLAARLMMVAQPGEILASDEARARAGPFFVWERLPAVQVKGKREPIPLNRLLRARRRRSGQKLEAAFPLPPLGRKRSQARLQKALAALRQGNGALLRLVGEAGMGKSHLAAHLAQQAHASGVRVAFGAAQGVAQGTPYLPWRQIFYTLLNLGELDEATAAAALGQYVAATHPESLLRLPLLGDLLDLPIADNPTTAALSSELRQESLFSLLAEMLGEMARRQPLLLIVDNAQWMDEVSVSLTDALARQALGISPILLLLLERTPGAAEPRLLPGLDQLPYASTVQLREIGEATGHSLVERKLGGPVAPLLVSLIHQVTRGNPFFVAELVAALQDNEQLAQDVTGQWQVGDRLLALLRRANVVKQSSGQWLLERGVDLSAVPLGLPDSIHALILSRLDRLPDAQKMTLKVCSVVGQTVDLALVAAAHPDGRTLAALRAEAAELVARAVLRVEEPENDLYAFSQHTTQEVIYDTLLSSQRQQLHRAVAEELSRASVPSPATAAIAHHAFLGEVWPLALRFNLEAGEQAKQLHANQQSIDFLQKALHSSTQLSALETAVQRRRLHLALGELFVLGGRHDDAARHLQAALELAREQGDREAEARAERWRARSYEQRGDYTAALQVIKQGTAVLGGALSAEAAELDLIAGLIYARQGDFQAALACCQHSLEVGRQLGDRAIRARSYNLMGIVELRSESATAVERFQQSLEQYAALKDGYGQATSHNLLANGYFASGQWRLADHHYREALDLFTQIGTVYSQVLVNNNLGGIALKQGRLDTALDYYRRALTLLEQGGASPWVLGALRLNMGNAYLQQGRLAAASAELAQAAGHLEQAQARDLLPELLGLQAELAMCGHDLEAAERFCQQSVDLGREIGMPREVGHSLRIQGEIAVARQQLGQAEARFQESCRLLEEVGDEHECARARLSLAALYLMTGRALHAKHEMDLCEPVFVRLEAQLDLQKVAHLRRQLAPAGGLS